MNTTAPPPWKDPKKLGLGLFAAFLFQLLILSGLCAKGLVPRFMSTRIKVRVTELKESNWRKSNHLRLDFEFSKPPKDNALLSENARLFFKEVETSKQNNSEDFNISEPIFISLKFLKNEDVWVPFNFSLEKPKDGKFIVGKALRHQKQILFGIEDFYFREGNEELYKQAVVGKKLVAEIFLAPNGQCQIKTLVIQK
ncbi:MAG: GDYXXLXY domain-containing protein [Gemmataceae bacterium]|jgi:uncharacterized membrane-anchored protein